MRHYRCGLLSLLLVVIPIGGAFAQRIITRSADSLLIRLSIDTVDGRCSASRIDVVDPERGRTVQTIVPGETDRLCDLPDDQVLIVEDIDFDGDDDLRLVQFIPAAPNVPYYYWRYDERSGTFERDTTLEEITSPEFDHLTHRITSFWRGGWRQYGTSVYAYIDGNVTLVEQREIRDDPDRPGLSILTVSRLIDGKMVTTVEELPSEEEGE